jgi:hypothetical protein
MAAHDLRHLRPVGLPTSRGVNYRLHLPEKLWLLRNSSPCIFSPKGETDDIARKEGLSRSMEQSRGVSFCIVLER